MPIISPHGHTEARWFAQNAPFPNPTELLIIPDHYIFRMLYSQGIPLENLGIPTRDGTPVETDHRKIWQLVCDHWHLFRGTPTGAWLRDELHEVFNLDLPLNGENAQPIYDAVSAKLKTPEFRPRHLFEQFNVEVLATTDAASDSLTHHQAIRDSGWKGRVIPTFRP